MKITRNIEVPTGNILIVEGEHGPLEMLSIGDYGKDVNLTAVTAAVIFVTCPK